MMRLLSDIVCISPRSLLAHAFGNLSLSQGGEQEEAAASGLLTNFLETVNANICTQSAKEGDFSMVIDLVDAPKLGSKGVGSKLLKNYAEMLDGGRVYDREGSPKNKLPLKYILMMTSDVIEEQELSDKSAYILIRRALDHALQADEAQTPFRAFFKTIQTMNRRTESQSDLHTQVIKSRVAEPAILQLPCSNYISVN